MLYTQQYEKSHKDEVKEYRSKRYQEKREDILKRQRDYRLKNREKISEQGKLYYADNKNKILEDVREYRINNRKKVSETKRSYEKERYQNDIDYRLRVVLRARLRAAIKNGVKTGSAIRDLGCSISEFKLRLESMFQIGMNWGNYGAWEIDHIKPLVKFDLTVREQLLQAVHYTNLQPLWAEENLRKGAR